MTWKSPVSHGGSASVWSDPENAYDEGHIIPSTRARRGLVAQQKDYGILFYMDDDYVSDKIDIEHDTTGDSVMKFRLGVMNLDYSDFELITDWKLLQYPDPKIYETQEFDERTVGVIRLELHNTSGLHYHLYDLYEICVWEVPPTPPAVPGLSKTLLAMMVLDQQRKRRWIRRRRCSRLLVSE